MAVCDLCGRGYRTIDERAPIAGSDLCIDCARLISRRLLRRGPKRLNRRDKHILKQIRKNSGEWVCQLSE